MEQDTITDERADARGATFDPTQHGIWRQFKDNGSIVHAAWVQAVHEGAFVGTCTTCGDYLMPLPPYHATKNRIDYEARCRRPRVPAWQDGAQVMQGCGGAINAPGGRLGSRKSSRPRGF